jgi:hypothetical protein
MGPDCAIVEQMCVLKCGVSARSDSDSAGAERSHDLRLEKYIANIE